MGPALLVSGPALMIKRRGLEQSESRAAAWGGGMGEEERDRRHADKRGPQPPWCLAAIPVFASPRLKTWAAEQLFLVKLHLRSFPRRKRSAPRDVACRIT